MNLFAQFKGTLFDAFCLQILVTTAQFKAIYEHIAEHIASNACMMQLASCLKLVPSCSGTSEMEVTKNLLQKNHWWSGLLGLDLHPRQNAFQGLACLRSRKNDSAAASKFLGNMHVQGDGSVWTWRSSSNCVEEEVCGVEDSILSNASTVTDGISGGACNELSMSFRQRVQMWMEASVVMPSATCMNVKVFLCPSKPLFKPHSNQKKRSITLVPGSVSPDAPVLVKKQDLWKELLFESNGLKWFRDALGGRDHAKQLFAQAYTNIQNISKPREVSEAANANKQKKKGGCPPWSLVHLSGSDACMCSLKLIQVPFQGHKRHQRNGVVFCFFGNRVFVSCMDAECKHSLNLRSRAYYALAKEVERIHSGVYPRNYLSSVNGGYGKQLTQILHGGVEQESQNKSPYISALSKISGTLAQEDVKVLQTEAEKRVCSVSDAQSLQDLGLVRLVPGKNQ